MAGTSFKFDDTGIGTVLYNGRLIVPVNQRPYAWTDAEVKALFQDLYEAIDRDDEDYFLGTIVLVQTGRELPVIADGQQRLATTSILLAYPSPVRCPVCALDAGTKNSAIHSCVLASAGAASGERLGTAFFVNRRNQSLEGAAAR